MPQKLVSFARLTWQTLAVLLVIFALTVSLIRGLLPRVPEIRYELLSQIESRYGVTLQVGKLDAKWQAYGPALSLNNVVVPPQETLPFTLIIEHLDVKLDFWESLLTLTGQIETVSFNGVQLVLDLDKLSQLKQQDTNAPTNVDWLYSLLLEQLGHFDIQDVKLQFVSSSVDLLPVYIKQLTWLNAQGKHLGQGAFYLDEAGAEEELLDLHIKLVGDGYQPDDITGEVYIAAKDLDLGAWASRQTNPSLIDKDKIQYQGVVNFEGWLTIANRTLNEGIIQFSPSWLEWQQLDSSAIKITPDANKNQRQRFDIAGGQLVWQQIPKGWLLNTQDFQFISNGVAWPELNAYLAYQDRQLFTQLNQIDLQLLKPLLPIIPNLGQTQVEMWQTLELSGTLGPVKAYKSLSQPWQAKADIQQVSWQAIQDIPGLSPVDMSISWAHNTASIAIPEQTFEIDFDGGFYEPLNISNAPLDVSFNTQTQHLYAPNVQFQNDVIDLSAAVSMHFANESHLSLAANLDIKDVSQAHLFFPLMAMSPNLVEYLANGLNQGNVSGAKVVWHGALNQYPYENAQGIFQAGFMLDDARFQFQPDWPAVDKLTLQALFENKLMDLTILSGELDKVTVDGARVWIPELGHESLLRVSADLTTKAQDAEQVIMASPLTGSVGKTLGVVQVSGDVNATLDLSIPLYKGSSSQINGSVTFANNPVYIAKPGIALVDVSGELIFENSLIRGEQFTSKLFNQPLRFGFATKETNQQITLDVDLASQWTLAQLPQALDNPLSEYYDGQFDWSGDLMMMFGETGFSLRGRVNSDLTGARLSFPPPFAKFYDERKSISAEVIGDDKQLSLSVKLAEQAEFWAQFKPESAELAFYELMLGRTFKLGDKMIKQDGHIHVDLPSAKFANWLPVIKKFTADKPSDADTQKVNIFPPLRQLDAKIDAFSLLAEDFTQLDLKAYPTDDSWRIEALADQIDGSIDFYPSWREQGIKVQAAKLHLSPEIKAEETADFSSAELLDNLPTLAVNIDDFKVNDMAFGQLDIQAKPDDLGYTFENIALTHEKSNIRINSTGYWRSDGDNTRSTFEVDLVAEHFHNISEILGISPGLRDAPLNLKGHFSWPGAPYQLTLATMDGRLAFEFGKGYLSQISDKGARIFSLFSLDSLLRKLTLDFSDVFGSGLYFNQFKGNLDIDKGVVKTTDTEMDAVAGVMKVRGYTDLTTQSLNYDVRFVPQLASSVPAVVFLSTSAWTLGIGAFALTKVLEPVIEVISELRFRLSGTMADPELIELERKSKEIEIPESILREVEHNQGDADTEIENEAQAEPEPNNPSALSTPQTQEN